ncbi:hypothetical protein IAG44_42410 [Streptomyces roseirectus]|uniref:Coenzyme PQQ synthesis protein A n=1 Tax=Streptomyces roseirectus TaxID=2768066 RepID=A0A7H0IRJ2_9ACTN|nr:hypothetical protein [Streptomyces roseirectus]QNP75408.1 hypothetical protein IAG44_42410 [Streptomyces roseirectus]
MTQHEERDDKPAHRTAEPAAEPGWQRPSYQIVEASMEMSAYFLTDRFDR